MYYGSNIWLVYPKCMQLHSTHARIVFFIMKIFISTTMSGIVAVYGIDDKYLACLVLLLLYNYFIINIVYNGFYCNGTC